MKKLLIASSAIVAVASVAGAAQAADPLKLSVGGYADFYTGYADQDDDYAAVQGSEQTGLDVQEDAEIHFKASTTLDNGLEIGFKYEMETQGTGNADELVLTVGTAYGTFFIGSEDSALDMIAMGHNNQSGGFGFLGDEATEGHWVAKPGGMVVQTDTAIDTPDDSEMITYVSPSFSGFTFGASYIPDSGTEGGDSPFTQADGSPVASLGGANVTADINSIWGVGAMYNGEFSGVSVGLEVGYASGDVGSVLGGQSLVEEHSQWQAGATFGYAGFTLGGAYRHVSNEMDGTLAAGLNDPDQQIWQVGLAYETGPYGVSLGYANSTSENILSNFDDDEMDMWMLGAHYTMGPGINLIGTVHQIEYDDGEAAGTSTPGLDNDGWAAVTGITLAF
jgi:predicted porin